MTDKMREAFEKWDNSTDSLTFYNCWKAAWQAAQSVSVPVVGKPVAWMLLRDSDKTFPRVFTSEQAADQLVAWNNVAPAIVKHGLYMQKLKSASDVDREMDYRTRLAQAEQELDALRKDAERYRWLRDGNDNKKSAACHIAVNCYGLEWDAAIDAAIAGEKE